MTVPISRICPPISAPLPSWPYLGYASWHLRMLEQDVLMGRRGVYGSDGEPFDAGTIITWPDPPWNLLGSQCWSGRRQP